MSKTQEPAATTAEVQPGLFAAIIDEKIARFAQGTVFPEGTVILTYESLEAMSMAELGELYSKVALVPAKTFKSKKVAVDSIVYQLGRKPEFASVEEFTKPNSITGNLDKPFTEKKTGNLGKGATAKADKPTKADKLSKQIVKVNTVEGAAEKIKAMPPQARVVMQVILDLCSTTQTPEVSYTSVSASINVPETAALLKTVQTPDRILSYYMPRLVDAGLVTLTQAA